MNGRTAASCDNDEDDDDEDGDAADMEGTDGNYQYLLWVYRTA